MPGRRPGADVPGCRRGRDGVRVRQRRDPLRHGRGPGAGGQGARDPREGPAHQAHLLRRSARTAALRPAGPRLVRPAPVARAGLPQGTSRRGGRRDRAGQGERRRRDVLHLGHDGQPEGRGARLRQPDRGGRRGRGDGSADLEGGGAGLPADGVDRPEHLLVHAVDGVRLHRELPGVGDDRVRGHAGDRADLLLCAAARARSPAHPGDDPDGGRLRDQAQDVPLLHGRRAARGRAPAGWPSGRARRPPAAQPRRPVRVRAAAQRARHEPHPRGLHGGRGDRAGPLHLLPLARHQPEAALRLHGDLGVRLRAAEWRREAGHRRSAGQGGRDPADRPRRDPDPLAGPVPRVLQVPGSHARGQGRRKAGSTRAMPGTSTRKAT